MGELEMKTLTICLPVLLAAGTGVIRTASRSDCKEICVVVNGCHTFTWSSTSLKCELKKHISNQYGIDLASCGTEFKRHQQREYTGTGSAIVTKRQSRSLIGMAECRDICNKTVDCIAFTYELKLGFCSLKNSQPYKLKKCADYLSGYKGEERLFYREFLGGDLANCATQTVVYDKTCT